jgi:formyltetrahydrofolate deformylase
MDTTNEHYILKINCPAASGIVAAISTCLAGQQCYISELAQFDDEFTGQFFMRAVFRFNTGVKGDIGALREDLGDWPAASTCGGSCSAAVSRPACC